MRKMRVLESSKRAIMSIVFCAALVSFNFRFILYYHELQQHDTARNEIKRPFPLPLEGKDYKIFQPSYDMDQSHLGPALFAPPNEFIQTFSKHITWLKTITPRDYSSKRNSTILERAQEMYIELIKSSVSATTYNDAELSVKPGKQFRVKDFNPDERVGGNDWAYLGETMTGTIRLNNVWNLLATVTGKNIPGDYIETGVWRGGSSIFARAIMSALGELDRVSFVCDSFDGLPPGDRSLDRGDIGWHEMNGYLAVSEDIVAANFHKYGLLGSNVVFAKGFFNETMPPLSRHVKKLAVMRLDGDMYESTVDVLYNLYDRLSIGGYLIMDDWFGFPSKTACEDFFSVHGIQPEIIRIDRLSAYWEKTEEVDIQYWRYEQNRFKPEMEKLDVVE